MRTPKMLILASASPRRHSLLQAAHIPHIVQPVGIDESQLPNELPSDYVRRLAIQKAAALQIQAETIILAADTTVAVENQIFGKPIDDSDAFRMLRALSGRDHFVYTGICLRSEKKSISDVAVTRVTFLELSDAEIQEYTRSGEPFDKAGAYAIQGVASKFVAGIEGCYHNVVGLPVSLVYRRLKSFEGIPAVS